MSHEAAASVLNGSQPPPEDDEEMLLDADEAEEEVPSDDDAHMDSDNEDDINLQNDSVAHFDHHAGNSIFCIAQHPTHPNIVATGGGDDDEDSAAGFGFVFDVSKAPTHVQGTEREGVQPLQKLGTHTDSITAVAFTLPQGAYLATAGLDGRLVAYSRASGGNGEPYTHLATAQEVEEINFLLACPHPSHPDILALGATDGSVWVYSLDASGLTILQTYYMHTGSCTAGAWTPDGRFLATASEDGSFYVWDVFGEGEGGGQQALVTLTAADERFKVEGGLYSVAVAPNGAFAAVGGAEGQIRVVGLPRVGAAAGGAKGKSGKQQAADKGNSQAGAILASLSVGTDSVETIAFAPAPLTLLAAGAVDGSISVFDTAKNFLLRRRVQVQAAGTEADEGHAIVKVEFVNDGRGGEETGWLLTSAGLDGVLRRYDLRSQGAGQGLLGEWKGHRGGGDGGGIMGFVQGGQGGRMVVTAGDDGIALVFDMNNIP